MMQLLGYISLFLEGAVVPYKLYYHPSDRKYHFRPEAGITRFPCVVAWQLECSWIFEGAVPESLRQQHCSHLDAILLKNAGPLL
ncbi:hypothetical protein EPD60_16150 [Flaviaesturariibacter flavus]|uniref:Uncharacterized protein n=1 Tax=Flaviaesturariibacter flavus TaxID=2502780 RepID=A0A4R1B667_9BACT|nr:hypothetical protein [Flaviaesturariibacter flavus]TCJ12087.1 hypothetical protein EPD60_16150 [Flaviaesturariibacter flavus]